jgi:hypothetical protein
MVMRHQDRVGPSITQGRHQSGQRSKIELAPTPHDVYAKTCSSIICCEWPSRSQADHPRLYDLRIEVPENIEHEQFHPTDGGLVQHQRQPDRSTDKTARTRCRTFPWSSEADHHRVETLSVDIKVVT